MSGRWFRDAAALFGASRRVLLKHIALRNHQTENYDKTSSLTRAIRSQTDRVTLTVNAATNLAARFSGPNAHYTNSAQISSLKASIPSKDSVNDSGATLPSEEGVEQDHYYNRSERNDTNQPVPDNALDIRQEKGKRDLLPDGAINLFSSWENSSTGEDDVSTKARKLVGARPTVTTESETPDLGEGLHMRRESNVKNDSSRFEDGEIPSSSLQAREMQYQSEAQIPSEVAEPPPVEPADQDSKTPALAEIGVAQEREVYSIQPSMSNPVLLSLPRVKLPRVTGDSQESDEHVSDAGMNQEVYYKSTPANSNSRTTTSPKDAEQDPISEEMYSEIFHSPKVARLLGGIQKRKQEPNGTNLPSPTLSPKRGIRGVQGKDVQASSSLSASNESFLSPAQSRIAQASKIPPIENARDSQQLAADIAEDVKTGPANGTEVILTLHH